MKSWRLVVLLLLFCAGAAALWFASTGRNDENLGGPPGETAQTAYDYEAHDVVLRQMDPQGRLTYQIEAREITQSPDTGRVTAKGLTLYHDPPGTAVGGPNRWTLTADSGELPAEGGLITLSGKVRAHGLLVGDRTRTSVATEQMSYDTTTQELSADGVVQLNWRGLDMQGRKLRANIGTRELSLGTARGTLVP